MSNNKFAAALFIFMSCIGTASALTIAEVAEHQRKKSISALNPISEEVELVKPTSVTSVRSFNYKLISTYQTVEGYKALVNNRGNIEVVESGDILNAKKVTSIADGSITLQKSCKKSQKCKSIKKSIGEGF